jgi:hypothetical protein
MFSFFRRIKLKLGGYQNYVGDAQHAPCVEGTQENGIGSWNFPLFNFNSTEERTFSPEPQTFSGFHSGDFGGAGSGSLWNDNSNSSSYDDNVLTIAAVTTALQVQVIKKSLPGMRGYRSISINVLCLIVLFRQFALYFSIPFKSFRDSAPVIPGR